MSYTVVNDNGVIQVRASIASRAEMNELGKALVNAEKHLPADPPSQDASAGEPEGSSPAEGGKPSEH